MSVLLVLCDSGDSLAVEAALRNHGESFRLSASSYLLHSHRRQDEISSSLSRLSGLLRPDSLFVIAVEEPRLNRVSADVHRWLQQVMEVQVQRGAALGMRSGAEGAGSASAGRGAGP